LATPALAIFMLHMLQEIPKHFQGFQNTVGDSMQHECDMPAWISGTLTRLAYCGFDL
jgi:hypothetical protein